MQVVSVYNQIGLGVCMNIHISLLHASSDYRFNKFAEDYGAGSRCINHGTYQSWRVNGKIMSDTGGGCYKVWARL